MTVIASVATYRPVWSKGSGRVRGNDQDDITDAVAAGRCCLGLRPDIAVERIVVVIEEPEVLNSAAAGVLRVGIGLREAVPVEIRLGAAVDALDAVASAAPRTMVVAVTGSGAGSAAAAALTDDDGAPGMRLEPCGTVDRSLPMTVRHLGSPTDTVYDDARLERERGWRLVVDDLAPTEGAVWITGVPARDAQRLGGSSIGRAELTGAAGAIEALRGMAQEGCNGDLIGIDAGRGFRVRVSSAQSAATSICERPGLPLEQRAKSPSADTDIPLSMPAYARAFDAKVGMRAGRCSCGELSFPPRTVCLACQATGPVELVDLPLTGEVYTIVPVHTHVPGLPKPYTLAIIALDGVPLRFLAPVTDAPFLSTKIGDRGTLVLRRLAVRQGVPDYGYAFAPDALATAGEVAS